MRNQKSNPSDPFALNSFKIWLELDQGLNPRTVSAYTSHLRKILKVLPDLSSESVTRYFDDIQLARDYRFNVYKMIWRWFVQFAAQERKIDLPMPDAACNKGLPHDVLATLAYMGSSVRHGIDGLNIPATELVAMTWSMQKMVLPSMTTVPFVSPTRRQVIYNMPRPMIAALKDYGKPQYDEAPLFPSKPGSGTALSLFDLQAELRNARKAFRRSGIPISLLRADNIETLQPATIDVALQESVATNSALQKPALESQTNEQYVSKYAVPLDSVSPQFSTAELVDLLGSTTK